MKYAHPKPITIHRENGSGTLRGELRVNGLDLLDYATAVLHRPERTDPETRGRRHYMAFRRRQVALKMARAA